jgi:CheY-like chemotaxis protein
MLAWGSILPASPLIAIETADSMILVADDNPVSLRFFAEALAQLGLACELAGDGVETVARAQRKRFDLLLIDARMPGLDGAEALARIRAMPGPSRDAVALATTADADERTRRDLVAAGFADIVTKPVSVDALRAAIALHVGSAEAESRALDDARALAATGGDASILAALRGLLVAEIDALPAELADLAARRDFAALRDRLHRLDASAGFCGAPGLARAGATLRAALGDTAAWPHAAVADFLAACADVRGALTKAGAVAER